MNEKPGQPRSPLQVGGANQTRDVVQPRSGVEVVSMRLDEVLRRTQILSERMEAKLSTIGPLPEEQLRPVAERSPFINMIETRLYSVEETLYRIEIMLEHVDV